MKFDSAQEQIRSQSGWRVFYFIIGIVLWGFMYLCWSHYIPGRNPWMIYVMLGPPAAGFGAVFLYASSRLAKTVLDLKAKTYVFEACYLGCIRKAWNWTADDFSGVLIRSPATGTSNSGSRSKSRPLYYVRLRRRDGKNDLDVDVTFDRELAETMAEAIGKAFNIPVNPPDVPEPKALTTIRKVVLCYMVVSMLLMFLQVKFKLWGWNG